VAEKKVNNYCISGKNNKQPVWCMGKRRKKRLWGKMLVGAKNQCCHIPFLASTFFLGFWKSPWLPEVH